MRQEYVPTEAVFQLAVHARSRIAENLLDQAAVPHSTPSPQRHQQPRGRGDPSLYGLRDPRDHLARITGSAQVEHCVFDTSSRRQDGCVRHPEVLALTLKRQPRTVSHLPSVRDHDLDR